jgi:hypothetical protein
MTEVTVYVAIWTHKHGTDVSVFHTEKGCEGWCQEIAADNWEQEMGDDVKPDDPGIAADVYFEVMSDRSSSAEYFETHTEKVLP